MIRQESPASFGPSTMYTQPVQSPMGFALFDKEEFVNAQLPGGGRTTEDDRELGSPVYMQAEREEETWLDEHAVPYLINRYNGTLIRGE